MKDFYIDHKIISPIGGEDYYQEVPASYMNKLSRRGELKDSENVVAFIKGTEKPDEIIVISAHLDHVGMNKDGEVFNGADDDGSGTVAVLEIAEAFKKAVGWRKWSQKDLFYSCMLLEKKKGLLGSRYYTENPIFPIANTITNLNIRYDWESGMKRHKGNPNYVYLIGSDKLSTSLHEVSEAMNTKYTSLELDYKYNDENDPNRFYYRSDHYNFAKLKCTYHLLF